MQKTCSQLLALRCPSNAPLMHGAAVRDVMQGCAPQITAKRTAAIPWHSASLTRLPLQPGGHDLTRLGRSCPPGCRGTQGREAVYQGKAAQPSITALGTGSASQGQCGACGSEKIPAQLLYSLQCRVTGEGSWVSAVLCRE